MSFKAIAWAWERELPPAEKLVLVGLANYADRDGFCFPSHRALAKDTGLSSRTVRRVCQALEAKSFIRSENTFREDGSLTVNRYLLRLDPTDTMSLPTDTMSLPTDTMSHGIGHHVLGHRTQCPSNIIGSTLSIEPANVHNAREARQPAACAAREIDPATGKKWKKPKDPSPAFMRFWAVYPRKVGREQAFKAWWALKPMPDLQAVMHAAITAQEEARASRGGEIGFVKHCATWINQKCWEDELSPEDYQPSSRNGRRPPRTEGTDAEHLNGREPPPKVTEEEWAETMRRAEILNKGKMGEPA